MSEKQRVRILAICFLALGIALYFIGHPIFALVMAFGGIVTFIIADKASNIKDEDEYMDDNFRYSR